jgi:hypothetical protein
MLPCFSLQHFRLHLEPKAPLQMPAYNKGSTLRLTPKGNVIRGGFGSTFRRFVCHCSHKDRARVRDRDLRTKNARRDEDCEGRS